MTPGWAGGCRLVLAGVERGWFWLWDAGGRDTITAAQASASVVIDLRAATLLQGDPHAGGDPADH